MTKAELAARVADRVHLTHSQAKGVINFLLKCVTEALRDGDKVELRVSGVFGPGVAMPGRGAILEPATRCRFLQRGCRSSEPGRTFKRG